MDEMLLQKIRMLQRNHAIREDADRGVFPFMVQCHLDFYLSEQALRRHMMRLARRGYLVRIGGADSRRGYRLALPVERVAARMGVTPYRAGYE